MTPRQALWQGLDALRIAVPAGARDKLLAYLELLAKWNKAYNLTAIREPQRMVSHHLLDSLAVVPHLPHGALADVGSGAGLPGIPLAIVEPGRPVALNDTSQKKAAFLQQALIELHIPNAEVHLGRVEAWRPPRAFDCVISRGFAELAKFVAACRHLVGRGGVLMTMKGVYPGRELREVPAWAGCTDVRRLDVPMLGAQRHLVICRCAP